MKHFQRATIALGTIIALGLLVGARQKTIDGARPKREIREVLDKQVEAWNSKDLEGFMQGYWRSPELTFYSGGTIVSGWEQTLSRYRNRYQSNGNEMGHLEFADIRIEMLGPDAAFARGRFILKMPDSTGLFTLTFRKFSNGWKIIHDHTST